MDVKDKCCVAQQIDSYKDLLPSLEDQLFCECNLVSESEIKEQLADFSSFEELLKNLKVGSGCRSCLKDINLKNLFNNLKG